jgi:hypothetical protein
MPPESQKEKKIKEMNWLTRVYGIEIEYKALLPEAKLSCNIPFFKLLEPTLELRKRY